LAACNEASLARRSAGALDLQTRTTRGNTRCFQESRAFVVRTTAFSFRKNYGSPFNDTAEHITGLGLARIDFERCAVAGEVIYSVEGDSTPTSQQDEEARIATLAHALKKLGNREDAAEFMGCLNAICDGADARYRQIAASYYYGEIAERGAGPALKEMALIAMRLASLNPGAEEVESDSEMVYALPAESKPRSLFDLEVAAVNRMIHGRR
jgi:hypothetical protein